MVFSSEVLLMQTIPSRPSSGSDFGRALAAQRLRAQAKCASCGAPMTGTARKRYCTGRCRQRAWTQARQGVPYYVERIRRVDTDVVVGGQMASRERSRGPGGDTPIKIIPNVFLAERVVGVLLEEWPEITVSTVMRHLSQRAPRIHAKCVQCRRSYVTTFVRQLYCSRRCKDRAARERKRETWRIIAALR
jgi:hypothetical protein